MTQLAVCLFCAFIRPSFPTTDLSRAFLLFLRHILYFNMSWAPEGWDGNTEGTDEPELAEAHEVKEVKEEDLDLEKGEKKKEKEPKKKAEEKEKKPKKKKEPKVQFASVA